MYRDLSWEVHIQMTHYCFDKKLSMPPHWVQQQGKIPTHTGFTPNEDCFNTKGDNMVNSMKNICEHPIKVSVTTTSDRVTDETCAKDYMVTSQDQPNLIDAVSNSYPFFLSKSV